MKELFLYKILNRGNLTFLISEDEDDVLYFKQIPNEDLYLYTDLEVYTKYTKPIAFYNYLKDIYIRNVSCLYRNKTTLVLLDNDTIYFANINTYQETFLSKNINILKEI